MKRSYSNIVYLHDYQDDVVEKFFEGDVSEKELFDHLLQWDYGDDHEVDFQPYHGSDDDLWEVNLEGKFVDGGFGELEEGYILSYNSRLGYAGLQRILIEE